MSKLSQYELEREANIARNRALFEQLELKQAVVGLGFPAKPAAEPKAKPVQAAKKGRKREREEDEEGAPRRSSRRLRSAAVVDPSESPGKRAKREAELEEQRAREEAQRLEEEERQRIAKRPRHQDLQLSEVLQEDDNVNDVESLTNDWKEVSKRERRVGDPSAFAFEDNKKDERQVEALKEKLQGMKVVSRAKVTQDRVYSAAYHPEVTKDLIFFGDKHGQLGIWDARAAGDTPQDDDENVAPEDRGSGKCWRLQVHWPATSRSSISSVKFDPVNSHNVYTTSYDCSVRCTSFETGISREVFNSEDILLSSMDTTPDGHELWVSDAMGGLTHIDLREPKHKATWFGLSDQKIGCVSINPVHPNFLLTASNSRALKTWDVRKLNSLTSSKKGKAMNGYAISNGATLEYDQETVNGFLGSKAGQACMRGEWRHDKSVSSAYWDPRGRSIVSTSYDDTLRLWDIRPSAFVTDAAFPSSRPFARVKHNCQTGRWLTVLRAQWNPNPDDYPHFTVGNMDHSLNIFSGKGDLIARLADRSKITAVQAVTCSHPNILERAASGNASGRCVLWAPADLSV